MQSEAKQPRRPFCGYCGSDNVRLDAYAVWDISRQEWVVGEVFDDQKCLDCDSDSNTLIEWEDAMTL